MNKVKSLYFGDSEIDNDSFKTLAQILTDAWFQMPAIQTGLKLSEKVTSPIYLYQYGYYGSMNMCDLVNLDVKKFLIKVRLENFVHFCICNDLSLLFSPSQSFFH